MDGPRARSRVPQPTAAFEPAPTWLPRSIPGRGRLVRDALSRRLEAPVEVARGLLASVKAPREAFEREAIDPRSRFVAELAGSLLRTMMTQPGHVITGSQIHQAVDMASETLKEVRARH